MEVYEYQTASGRRPYLEWIRQLKDRQSAFVVRNRIKRLRLGQLGDHRHVGSGVFELRIFFGPGYRIYCLMDGDRRVILLIGGDKDSQERDIAKAKDYAVDYWRRK
jgi:putative addiction module killer protein